VKKGYEFVVWGLDVGCWMFTAKATGVCSEILFSKSRRGEVVYLRMLCVLMLRKFTFLSLQSIATAVGLTDHTGVLHHIRKSNSLIEVEPLFRRQVQAIIKT
jgi:chromosomal replication initiation ATPase DnaA